MSLPSVSTRHKEYVMANKSVTCPKCKCKFDITKERREQFNCPVCNTALVRTVPLPKGEPVIIDGRHVA